MFLIKWKNKMCYKIKKLTKMFLNYNSLKRKQNYQDYYFKESENILFSRNTKNTSRFISKIWCLRIWIFLSYFKNILSFLSFSLLYWKPNNFNEYILNRRISRDMFEFKNSILVYHFRGSNQIISARETGAEELLSARSYPVVFLRGINL